MKIALEKLNYCEIKNIAEGFLQKYHPNLSIPIPVENITELQLGFSIVTIPLLKSSFDIDGFINSTFDQITLDDELFNLYEERSRFTIAHELGHWVLHSSIYSKYKIEKPEDYIKFQNEITEEDQKWLEIQANIFAACFLVPTSKLKEELDDILKKENITNELDGDYFIPYLEQLPSKFKVSWAALYRRMQKENLIKF